jgi:hypothetical protein
MNAPGNGHANKEPWTYAAQRLNTCGRVISLAEDKLAALGDLADGFAHDVRNGYLLQSDVMDRLHEVADAYGLLAKHGEDKLQQVILEGLERANNFILGEEWSTPRPGGTGHTGADKQEERIPWSVPAFIWRDSATIPRRVFLYGHCYARGFVSATIADGGIGKSLLKMVELLAMATRRSLLGITPTERIRVLYWNGDDPYVEVERRIHAVCQHYEIDLKALLAERWLFVGTRDKQPLCLAEMKGRGVALNQNAIDDICNFIQQNEIGLACFDPLKSLHRVPENSNDDMDVIGDAFNVIAERTNAAIGLDHHIRKPAFGQVEATAADARGATALINKVRLSRVLNQMTPALAQQARIKEDDRRRHFRADSGKVNIAPPSKASWYRVLNVPCANGEDTPTVAPWTFPGAFDAVTIDHVHRIRAMAAEGCYRKDARAEDWIGHAVAEVLDLDLDEEADNKQVKEILKAWFANGVLKTEDRKDEKRRPREFVVPGNWNDEAAPV